MKSVFTVRQNGTVTTRVTPCGVPNAAGGSRFTANHLPWLERPPPAGKHFHLGFTLIELLAVIAIIAVLAALLLPVLSRGKEKARQVYCLSNLKQWGAAIHSYTHENDDWLPREGYHAYGRTYWNNWAQVANPRSLDVWYNALSNHVGVPPAAHYALPGGRDDFYERPSLFHCPSAGIAKARAIVSPEIALFSVAMNSQLITEDHYPTTKISRIHKASQTPLVLDNLLDGEKPVVKDQAKNYLGQPASEAHRFAGRRHGQTGNLVYADGSGKAVAGTKVVETQGNNRGYGILPAQDVLWDPDCQ